MIRWHHYHVKKYKNGNEKIVISNIIIIGIPASIRIKVDIFLVNKIDGDPITWFFNFFIFYTIFGDNIR